MSDTTTAFTATFGSSGVADAYESAEAMIEVLGAAGFADVVLSTHTVVMHFEGGVRQALTAMAATPLGPT